MKNFTPLFLLTFVFTLAIFMSCGDGSEDPKKNDNPDDGDPPVANTYSVTNSGTSAYLFTGNGLSSASNPSLTLTKGVTYTFNISASGHPFWINQTQGTGTSNAYSTGVSGNGSSSGTITFTVPNDAPSTLFYNCQFHNSMTGTITIVTP